MKALLLPALLLLAACATTPPVAQMSCPQLAEDILSTHAALQQARNSKESPVKLNIGLGRIIGNGSIAIDFGVPLGTPTVDAQRVAGLENRLAELKRWHAQKACPGSQSKP